MAAGGDLIYAFRLETDVRDPGSGGGTVEETFDGGTITVNDDGDGGGDGGSSTPNGGSNGGSGGGCVGCGDEPAPSSGPSMPPGPTTGMGPTGTGTFEPERAGDPVEDVLACFQQLAAATSDAWAQRSVDPLATHFRNLSTTCVLTLVVAALVVAWLLRELGR